MKSNIVQELLDKITPEEHAQFERRVDEYWAYRRWLEEQGKEHGTDTSISLDILREAGHFPIAICNYLGEECFLFKSKVEADRAWEDKVLGYDGWWYSKKDFEKEIEEEVKIYWLI